MMASPQQQQQQQTASPQQQQQQQHALLMMQQQKQMFQQPQPMPYMGTVPAAHPPSMYLAHAQSLGHQPISHGSWGLNASNGVGSPRAPTAASPQLDASSNPYFVWPSGLSSAPQPVPSSPMLPPHMAHHVPHHSALRGSPVPMASPMAG